MKPIPGHGCVDSTMRRLRLSPYAWAVWAVLASYANREHAAWPSIRSIALASGMLPRKVTTTIRELEDAHVIHVERHPRALSRYTFLPQLCWKLCCEETQIGEKSVSPHDTAKPESVSPDVGGSVQDTFDPQIARRWNDGREIEKETWEWLAAIPFLGQATKDVRTIPIDVRRSPLARQLMHNAWNRNKAFMADCAAIWEWYSWPWVGDKNDKRKTSVRGLIRDWQEQADLARWHIAQREKFRVIDSTP